MLRRRSNRGGGPIVRIHPAKPTQLHILCNLLAPYPRGEIAAFAGYSVASLYRMFMYKPSPKFDMVEALFNAVGYTLHPIPKDRLDDVRKYLAGSTTGT